MRETTNLARQAGEGQPPEEQLRRFVHIFLRRLTAPGPETVRMIVHREMHDPTPALDDLTELAIRPRIEYLSGVIARMTGCDPGDEVVLRCVGSLQSQALSYLHKPIATRLGLGSQPTADEVDEAARHITAFSIAGIHAVAGASAEARRTSRSAPRRRQRAG